LLDPRRRRAVRVSSAQANLFPDRDSKFIVNQRLQRSFDAFIIVPTGRNTKFAYDYTVGAASKHIEHAAATLAVRTLKSRLSDAHRSRSIRGIVAAERII
jgi:hypothetical protein